jgi:hypothetical protein
MVKKASIRAWPSSGFAALPFGWGYTSIPVDTRSIAERAA